MSAQQQETNLPSDNLGSESGLGTKELQDQTLSDSTITDTTTHFIMGTPFISLHKPGEGRNCWNYARGKPYSEQDDKVPKTLLHAMEVREKVYVEEQKVPLENEFDDDDPRSCHWVIYASINQTIVPAIMGGQDGLTVIQARRSKRITLPIGTIRLVPFPHESHPVNGGAYVNGILTNAGQPVSEGSTELVQAPERITTTTSSLEALPSPITNGIGHNTTTFIIPDRETDFHNSQEPYLKIGRLAVLPEYRRQGIAGQLVKNCINWMQDNYTLWNPSPTEHGFDRIGVDAHSGIMPKWRGLVCIHAQAHATSFWYRYGFRIDEKMGKWTEEGIPHVGMWLRVPVGKGAHTEPPKTLQSNVPTILQ
ncbi:hypothetical protein QBC35DRAFT_501738 [Podospora australis]|uniref:N-acetyltransferase domain-containing protein n=1 Tax=Podospora australis TaxID=1536484 RepID=A0AAN6WTZ4_9PEZI|nr:hypothetical protein QBC35DRAFT_501738 [Podospora australis]